MRPGARKTGGENLLKANKIVLKRSPNFVASGINMNFEIVKQLRTTKTQENINKNRKPEIKLQKKKQKLKIKDLKE